MISSAQKGILKSALLAGCTVAASSVQAKISLQSGHNWFRRWKVTGELPTDLRCKCRKLLGHIGSCERRRVRPKPEPIIVQRPVVAGTSFEAEVWEMKPRLYAYALMRLQNRARAEDFVSDTIVRALAAKSSFENGTNFTAWIYTILRNLINSSYRQGRRRPQVSIDTAELVAPASLASPERTTETLLAREAIIQIAHLPQPQRDVCFAVFLDEMSYTEVSKLYSISEGTVKSRLWRARVRLKERMGETEPNEDVVGTSISGGSDAG